MISTWTPILILFDNAFQQQPPPPVISKATSSSNEVGTDGTGTGSEEDERALPPHQRLLNEHKRKWSGNRDNGGHGHNSHDLSLAARRSPAAMAAAAAAAVAGTGPPPERFHPVKLLCSCFRFQSESCLLERRKCLTNIFAAKVCQVSCTLYVAPFVDALNLQIIRSLIGVSPRRLRDHEPREDQRPQRRPRRTTLRCWRRRRRRGCPRRRWTLATP